MCSREELKIQFLMCSLERVIERGGGAETERSNRESETNRGKDRQTDRRKETTYERMLKTHNMRAHSMVT